MIMTFKDKLFALAIKKGLNQEWVKTAIEENAQCFEYLSLSKALDACMCCV